MTLMEQWAIVFESYKEANFWGLVKKTLTKSKSRLLAVLTFIFFFFSIIWSFNIKFRFIKTYPHIDYLVLFFPILASLLFERAIKNSFKKYYKDNIQSKLLKCYRKDREYERYLLFKEKLAHKKEEIDFRQILPFIDNELEMAKVSMFKQHPFLVVLIGIVTAIAGGLANREQGWTTLVTPLILIWVLFILFFSIWYIELFKTREYKLCELKKFIFWLEQEF